MPENTPSTRSPSPEIQEIDIREYVLAFKGEWKTIAFAVLVGLVAALLYAYLTPPTFTATSKFIAKTNSPQPVSQFAGLAQMAGLNMGSSSDQEPFSYLNEIVRNEDFLDSLADRRWPYRGENLTLADIFKVERDTTLPDWPLRYRRKVLDLIREDILSFSGEKGLQVLAANAGDPHLAFAINRHTLDYLNDYIRTRMKSRVVENRLFVEERIKEVQGELIRSEETLNAFQRTNRDLSSPNLEMHHKRLLRNVSVNEELYLQLRKQLELARIDEKKDQPLIIVVKQPEVPLWRSSPRRKVAVAAGLFFGLAIGIGAAFVRIILKRPA